MKFPTDLKNSKSLLAKYLTKEVFEQLKDKKTSNGFTLNDVIKSGIKNLDSGIGAYVGDEESYVVFAPLFDKIIKDYHGFETNNFHKSNLNPNDLLAPNPDIDNKFIVSTRIRVARNIKDIPLGTAIPNKQRNKIEKKIANILNSFTGELAGKYYALNNLSSQERETLVSDHFLFKSGDRFLDKAGLNRDWPNGRGIFHNKDKTFLVWINEEDQLRIISMQKGGDIEMVFTRLVKAIELIQKEIDFAYNKHLGYITSCPTNLGTAMRASVHIKLPNLGKNKIEFKEIADKYHVQIRGIDGEHSKNKGNVYDISNKRRLGVTEVACVQDMYNGVVALIKREKELEKTT
jgi:creatine kinase/arginine kinase